MKQPDFCDFCGLRLTRGNCLACRSDKRFRIAQDKKRKERLLELLDAYERILSFYSRDVHILKLIEEAGEHRGVLSVLFNDSIPTNKEEEAQ